MSKRLTSGEAPQREIEATPPVVEPPPLAVADTPIVVQFEVSRSSVKAALAEAYHQAALADADMAAAARILEQTRTSLLTEPDVFKIWRRLDDAIGAADATTLRPVLSVLRVWFRDQLFDQQQKRLGDLFKWNPEVGWREWLRTYAEGLARWRLLLCRNLVDSPFPFPEHFHKPYDFKRATQLILHQRWPEVYQFFTFLAGHEFLHPHTRARLLIPAAQIHLYHFIQRDRALTCFQQAEQLAPGLGGVLAALGDYYGEQNDRDKSRTYLEQAMQAAPDDPDAYVFMGDLAEKQGNLEEARMWHQEAINRAVGDSSGYIRLLRLYGRPEFIERYESHLPLLAERANVVGETGEYGTYLDVGDAYAATKRYDKTHEWYDKAIHLDPERLGGYISEGFAYLDEGESQFEAARAAFQKALEVAPEAYNGYWGMGQLAERRGQWAEAAEWYAQAVRRQSEFYSSIQSKIGEMHKNLGHFEEAEAALLDALKHDRTNDATALDLAENYYKTQRKPEEALRLFRQIREIKGEAFEAGYQNRVGNVYFYEKDYDKAAQHYLNAIQSNDREAVYFSNLSGAYRGLERWTDAREYLRKAYSLHGDREKYESQLARIFSEEAQALVKSIPTSANGLERLDQAIAQVRTELEQAQGKGPFSEQLSDLEQLRAFVARYGKHALTFDPKDKPIRVRVESVVLSLILNADRTELSKDFLSLDEAMRERLRGRYGLSIPGLHFTYLTAPSTTGYYQIDVMDEQVADGQLEADEMVDAPENLLRHIERVLASHLDKLCGYQETANLLAQCQTDDCAQIKDDPHKLSALTRRLKTILRQGGAITNLAQIAAEVNEQSTSGSSVEDISRLERPAPELTPGITALTLDMGKLWKLWPLNRTQLTQEFVDLQEQLFNELGVIAPQVTIADSQSVVGQIGFQLQINNEKLPTMLGFSPVEFVAAELRQRADQLLTPQTVEYYLTRLKAQAPALVNVARHYFSVEELTGRLRERLSRRSSIKNLPRVLEELISADRT